MLWKDTGNPIETCARTAGVGTNGRADCRPSIHHPRQTGGRHPYPSAIGILFCSDRRRRLYFPSMPIYSECLVCEPLKMTPYNSELSERKRFNWLPHSNRLGSLLTIFASIATFCSMSHNWTAILAFRKAPEPRDEGRRQPQDSGLKMFPIIAVTMNDFIIILHVE